METFEEVKTWLKLKRVTLGECKVVNMFVIVGDTDLELTVKYYRFNILEVKHE